MTVKLSNRLQQIASYVPDGARVVDVGTDHALLPIYLVQHHRVQRVIATDVAAGPVQAAIENVARHDVSELVSVRHGDGLKTVLPGEVDTIVIAGMGGSTAVDILGASPGVVSQAKRIIIQPMNASRQVRRFLRDTGFGLMDEQLLSEDGRWYEVLVAETDVPPAQGYQPFSGDPAREWMALEFGPYILARNDEAIHICLHSALEVLSGTLCGLQAGRTDTAMQRKREVERQIAWIHDWLKENEV